jgi:Protein of unknown function (DUF2726)
MDYGQFLLRTFRGTKFAALGAVHPEQLAPFLPILLALIVAVVALVLKGVRRVRGAGKPSDEQKDLLFNPAEHSFLGVLKQILGKEYRIIRKVRIADIIRPQEGFSQSAHMSALNRITSKHLDFAVCDLRTMQVVGVIELDEPSDNETSRRRRDKLVAAALSSAGIPLVRIPAQRAYTPAEIHLRLSGLLATANPSSWRIQPRLMFRG